MTAEGPTKRRTLLCSMRNGFRTPPAHSVRGSSRRIMSLRFRPAYIRVINRRASSSAVFGPAVQNEKAGFPFAEERRPYFQTVKPKGLTGRSLSELVLNSAICRPPRCKESVFKVVLIQHIFRAHKEPHGPELAQRQAVADTGIHFAKSIEAVRPGRKRVHKIREHRPEIISGIERVEGQHCPFPGAPSRRRGKLVPRDFERAHDAGNRRAPLRRVYKGVTCGKIQRRERR